MQSIDCVALLRGLLRPDDKTDDYSCQLSRSGGERMGQKEYHRSGGICARLDDHYYDAIEPILEREYRALEGNRTQAEWAASDTNGANGGKGKGEGAKGDTGKGKGSNGGNHRRENRDRGRERKDRGRRERTQTPKICLY